jgi:hypothetical protein
MEYESLREEYDQRVESSSIIKFLLRLDTGWNRSSTRLCQECGKFQPVTEEYWNKKVKKYLLRGIGPKAEAWRLITDCMCGSSIQTMTEPWINYGKLSKTTTNSTATARSVPAAQPLKQVKCPDCNVGQACNCDCRYDRGCCCPCGVCCGPCGCC